jgi:hypothetical protein
MKSEFNSNALFGELMKQLNSNFERCFWPSEQCSKSAIRAHSVQNATALELLAHNGHVVMPKIGLKMESGPYFFWELIGKSKATTFTGLCSKHDAELFRPIDTNLFHQNNSEQLFLIAYRSILRELHAKMKAASDIQSQYARGVEIGKFDPAAMDYPMQMATMAMAEAYSFYRYKFEFDTMYRKKVFGELKHQINFISGAKPTIAVSSVFSFIDNMKHLDNRVSPKCVCLNVFPVPNGIYIIFSYLKYHSALIEPHLPVPFQENQAYLLYQASKLILTHCENFALSPMFFDSWSDDKKKLLEDFFMKNIHTGKADGDHEDYYLFSI